MRKSASLLFTACALLLPLTGCSTDDPNVADSTNETSGPDSSATDDGSGSTEQLTQEVTAANKKGNVEVTITVPDSWNYWGPGDIVKRGKILDATKEFEDHALLIGVLDPEEPKNSCTPEDLASEQCDLTPVEYTDYEPLEPITIAGYEAHGATFVADFDDYKTREQHWFLEVDGAPLRVQLVIDNADEEIPQILFDIRDSMTFEIVD